MPERPATGGILPPDGAKNPQPGKFTPRMKPRPESQRSSAATEAERKKANDEAAGYRIREKEADQRKLTEETSTAELRASLEKEFADCGLMAHELGIADEKRGPRREANRQHQPLHGGQRIVQRQPFLWFGLAFSIDAKLPQTILFL